MKKPPLSDLHELQKDFDTEGFRHVDYEFLVGYNIFEMSWSGIPKQLQNPFHASCLTPLATNSQIGRKKMFSKQVLILLCVVIVTTICIVGCLPRPPVPRTFTITATHGANGSIHPVGEVTVTKGEDQAFAIIPDTGYRVADVVVDGCSVGAVTCYIFENVTADHTIYAKFEAI